MSKVLHMADLITAKDAERILRKSRRTVVRWAEQGRLPYVQKLTGDTGAWLFDRAAVEALRDELDAQFDEGAA